MKRILFPSLILLFLVACGGNNPTTHKSSLKKDQITSSDEQEHLLPEEPPQPLILEPLPPIDSALMRKITTGNAITIRYTKPVRGYTVRGWCMPSEVWGEAWDVVLHFKGNGTDFMVNGGHVHYLADSNQQQELLSYEERYEQGVLCAPYDLFFFADLDFDGIEELITHREPFMGSQRSIPAYTEIYTFREGYPQRATALFCAKNKLFSAIEPHYFMVNSARKELYQYFDGGALGGGWQVYKYEQDTYRYDHYVNWQELFPSDSIAVKIRNVHNQTRRSFVTDKKTFNKERWTY